LIVEFTRDGIPLHTLYKRQADWHVPRLGTVGRHKEVQALAREGLQRALQVRDVGDVADLGASGYTVREDVLDLPIASSGAQKTMRRAAQR
jgi:hypothetical protein